jgi:formate/nitrite transporter FocA (FNT family)
MDRPIEIRAFILVASLFRHCVASMVVLSLPQTEEQQSVLGEWIGMKINYIVSFLFVTTTHCAITRMYIVAQRNEPI